MCGEGMGFGKDSSLERAMVLLWSLSHEVGKRGKAKCYIAFAADLVRGFQGLNWEFEMCFIYLGEGKNLKLN